MANLKESPMPTIDSASIARFQQLDSCAIADALPWSAVFASGIHSLWLPAPRIAGPAFTVHCPAGDNLMLHAAIHRAPAGSIIVVQSDPPHFALAGGNVALVAQQRGIAGFVFDGVIRDGAEIREAKFPVYARGTMPKPGTKDKVSELCGPISCGGIVVNGGDIIVADEEGIVAVPHGEVSQVLKKAEEKARQEAVQTLDDWRSAHQAKITKRLTELMG